MEKTKITIKETIIVEGRDDTAAINRSVDAATIETHGFGMSQSMWHKIEAAYEENGIIIFTDPDYAGEQIRRKILSRFPNAKQAFLSQEAAEKKGNIGIENASPSDIREALSKACYTVGTKGDFTESDLLKGGLMGGAGAKERREKLGELLGIGYGNSKSFLKKLNSFGITREKFEEKIKEL